MTRESLNWWLALLANLGVLGGLVFVGLEIRQNNSQLRAEASRSITESVNALNAAVYSSPDLASLLLKGRKDLQTLDAVEREQFDRFYFSQLNIAEHVQDLEGEGIADLSFRFVEFVVREFNEEPGLRAFIQQHEGTYVGSEILLGRLLGR